MRAMLFAFIATILIAVVADVALDYSGFSAAERFSLKDVRL
ncbi:MAG: hypothetical protein AAFR17_10770 [Pseudomonadota bacterium]